MVLNLLKYIYLVTYLIDMILLVNILIFVYAYTYL